ncbi:MAG: hypothetical protein RL060_592 [Bacteroidota bacterium]|jgi:hypothetical protein
MTSTFTQKNDIIRFVYAETTVAENEVIMQDLLIDDVLYDFYIQCAFTKENIDQLKVEPSESCIQNILQYSKMGNMVIR